MKNTANELKKSELKKGYIIDNEFGSGSGCDTIFDSYEEAEFHMSFWTEEERKGCYICEIEVF